MNEIKNYTTEDFARYHAGTMPAGEMHALERAALEDPFLEDALEGYSITPTPASDAAVLRKRISDAVSAKKVFFLSPKKGWWRIAALLVIMAGAGYLFFTINNKMARQNSLAKNEKTTGINKAADSLSGFAVQDTATVHLNGNIPPVATASSPAITIPSQGSTLTWATTTPATQAPVTSAYTITPGAQQADLSPVATPPVNTAADESAARPDLSQNNQLDYYRNAQSNKAVNDIARNNNVLNNNALSNDLGYNNFYKKDQNGISAAPIASAADRKANAGTFDDQDKFKIVSDSAMFAKTAPPNNTVADLLKKSAPGIAAQKAKADSDAVAALGMERRLKDKELAPASATFSSAEIVSIPVKKSAGKNSEVELSGRTSVPPSGQTAAEKAAFDKYIKDNMQPVYNQAGGRMAGEVLLSFTVKKNRPKNIKVAMSLCPLCEAQAIQLLENGPDWSGKKNEEKTVIIKF